MQLIPKYNFTTVLHLYVRSTEDFIIYTGSQRIESIVYKVTTRKQ